VRDPPLATLMRSMFLVEEGDAFEHHDALL
jgi:hypothetical protein